MKIVNWFAVIVVAMIVLVVMVVAVIVLVVMVVAVVVFVMVVVLVVVAINASQCPVRRKGAKIVAALLR